MRLGHLADDREPEPGPRHPASRLRSVEAVEDEREVGLVDPGGEVEVTVRDGELTVRDHGPGIDEADLPFVFDRFYRAPSARGMPGSGLGLAIVRQVAEAHGGTVVADRADGGGTLMRLTLHAKS